MLLQLLSYFVQSFPTTPEPPILEEDVKFQVQINQLKKEYLKTDSLKIYPFNPNYITDFKGYTLGMSPEEIDRLNRYRSNEKYVNSPEEFQKVTLISDSLLHTLSPYFKFPDWTQRAKSVSVYRNTEQVNIQNGSAKVISRVNGKRKEEKEFRDLNLATEADLKSIYGVGDVLSKRIVKFRDRLGGFLVMEQLGHVYGLEPEVVARMLKEYRIYDRSKVLKININEASAAEIAELVYIKYEVALRVVAYREANGALDSFEELRGIADFPSEKIHIIQLYLQL